MSHTKQRFAQSRLNQFMGIVNSEYAKEHGRSKALVHAGYNRKTEKGITAFCKGKSTISVGGNNFNNASIIIG